MRSLLYLLLGWTAVSIPATLFLGRLIGWASDDSKVPRPDSCGGAPAGALSTDRLESDVELTALLHARPRPGVRAHRG